MKLNLAEAYRVLVGTQTRCVYLAQGEETIEEHNGTVIERTPRFQVGDKVKIRPDAIMGFIGVTGYVECIFIATDARYEHAYGVRAMGVYAVYGADDLKPGW
jgi:hypothetical protein